MINFENIAYLLVGFFGSLMISGIFKGIKKIRSKLKISKLKKKVELINPDNPQKVLILDEAKPKKVKKVKVKKIKKKKEKPFVIENDLRELNPKPKKAYKPKFNYVRGYK